MKKATKQTGLRQQKPGSRKKADGQSAVLANIAPMPAPDRAMWPTAFALKDLTAAAETRIRALVKKAVS